MIAGSASAGTWGGRSLPSSSTPDRPSSGAGSAPWLGCSTIRMPSKVAMAATNTTRLMAVTHAGRTTTSPQRVSGRVGSPHLISRSEGGGRAPFILPCGGVEEPLASDQGYPALHGPTLASPRPADPQERFIISELQQFPGIS